MENNRHYRKERKKNKSHKGLIVTLVIVLILAISFLVLNFLFHFNAVTFVASLFDSRLFADSISFEKSSYDIGVGQEFLLDPVLSPDNTKTTYVFESKDKDIISVLENSKGINGLKEGKTTLFAYTNNFKKSETTINVLKAPSKLKAKCHKNLIIDESYKIKVNSADGEASPYATFSCSDEKILSVDENGKITPLSIGKATITAKSYNGLEVKKDVNVFKKVEAISLNYDNLILAVEESADISYTLDENSYSEGISFSSDDESVATIDENGHVVAIAEGTATITVEASDGVKAECSVNVIDKYSGIRKNLDTSKPMVALTFDDGPNKDNTKKIINTLNKYNARGTFFVIGYLVESQADVIKKEFDDGHEIGNHSWDHSYATNISAEQQLREVSLCNEAIYNVTGKYPTLFRCPGGFESDVYNNQINMPLINWDIDTRDWEHKDSARTLAEIKAPIENGGNLDGDIVLMHDLQESTGNAINSICKYLTDKGYLMVTISELAYYKGVDMQNGKTYRNFYNN